jgi:hypothetical protein
MTEHCKGCDYEITESSEKSPDTFWHSSCFKIFSVWECTAYDPNKCIKLEYDEGFADKIEYVWKTFNSFEVSLSTNIILLGKCLDVATTITGVETALITFEHLHVLFRTFHKVFSCDYYGLDKLKILDNANKNNLKNIFGLQKIRGNHIKKPRSKPVMNDVEPTFVKRLYIFSQQIHQYVDYVSRDAQILPSFIDMIKQGTTQSLCDVKSLIKETVNGILKQHPKKMFILTQALNHYIFNLCLPPPEPKPGVSKENFVYEKMCFNRIHCLYLEIHQRKIKESPKNVYITRTNEKTFYHIDEIVSNEPTQYITDLDHFKFSNIENLPADSIYKKYISPNPYRDVLESIIQPDFINGSFDDDRDICLKKHFRPLGFAKKTWKFVVSVFKSKDY